MNATLAIRARLHRVYYGWWIVLGSMAAFAIGSIFYWHGFSIFFLPLQEEFSTNRAALSGAIALSQLEGGMLGPIGGYMVDRYGPRRIMFIGISLMGLGFLLMSQVHSLLMFYIVYLLTISIGMSVGIRVPSLVGPANWFIRKRGRALGLALVGSGVGGLFLPVLAWLMVNQGWRATAIISGISIWVLGLPLTAIMRRRPEEYGLLPDGDSPESMESAPMGHDEGSGRSIAVEQKTTSAIDADYTVGQALKLPVFWLLAVAFGLRQFVVGAISLHQVPFFVDFGIDLEVAATLLAAVTFTSIAGRLGFGLVAEKVPPRYAMTASIVLVGLAALVLANASATWHLGLFVVFYALGWGGGATVMNVVRGAYFGRKAFGTISGTMDFFQMFGLVLGPVFAGYVFDVTGSYHAAFTTFAVSAALSAVLMLFLRAPRDVRM